jgi:hypothetical protein
MAVQQRVLGAVEKSPSENPISQMQVSKSYLRRRMKQQSLNGQLETRRPEVPD